MSLALARKYRPATFDDLIGQDSVSQTLSLALDSDRLSHAYLFSGLRGSGKTSTARIFAKALLCEEGTTSHPCGKCAHCIMAAENRHMDIIEMDAASNRGIDDIKDLIEHTKYKPSSARYKIFIIDEVHMLTTQAFNALLKTLEEPPDFVKFILATTDPLKLPATILSRTQHFRFKKIPHKLVLHHLEHILHLEKIEYEKEALDIIARSGAGSLRDSLTLLDQAIVYSKNFVDLSTVTGMLGIIEPSLLETLIDDIVQRDTDKILTFIKLASDYEAEMILDELTLYLKELLLSGNGKLTPMIIERFFRVIAESKSLLALGADGEFVLSLALFKMMEALEIKDIDTMIRGLEKELKGVEVNKTTLPPHTIPAIKGDRSSLPATEKTRSPLPASTQEAQQKERTEESTGTSPHTHHSSEKSDKFKRLVSKIYDRNYELGSCFERNIEFERFENNTLTWHSVAEGDDKKMLRNNWGLIHMFVKEIFDYETKIANITRKREEHEEPRRENMPEEQPHAASQWQRPHTPAPSSDYPPEVHPSSQPVHNDADTGSMIEELEMQSSSIASEAGEAEATKEKDPSVLLEEPMVKAAMDLLEPKKVRIKRNT